jgi:NADH oxidase (H2O2-forming)
MAKTKDKINNIVIIGCSGTGALAAGTIKKLKPSLNVTVIREQEEKGLLTRCATPYIASGNVMVNPSYKSDSVFSQQGIKLVNVKAVDINKTKKIVTTADGITYSYDKLILATGAKPFLPPIKGIELGGVFTLRTSGDAVSILNWINSRRVENAVVIGAGAIGVEIAYLTARHELKVTLVEMMSHAMQNFLDPDMSIELENYIKSKGLDLKLNTKVNKIGGKKHVESVDFASRQSMKAEMVIVSAGVKPNDELARKACLEIGKYGLKVNQYLQTSDPDIYAAGDLIEYPDFVTGKITTGRLRPNAVIGGRVIAHNILGYQLKFPQFINSFATKFFDKSIAGAGITEERAKTENMNIISVKQSSFSKHSMMREKKPYTVKLIFEKKTGKIVGGQILSESEAAVKQIDVIALAIRCGLTACELVTFRAAGQPELSPDPGIEPISLAAAAAFQKLNKK